MALAYGNGGANYGTANNDMKKKLVENQTKLKNDPSYGQSEVARALQVYKDRQSQGLDTSAQQKYLTSNLGYKGPLSNSGSTGSALSNSPTPLQTTVQQNAPKSNSQYGSEMMNSIRELAQKQSQQFSYDPNSDPAYQAALRRAQENAQTASGNAMAELNKRGILNSSITSDRLGQIEQSEYGRVSDTILPQLMQQAYGRYQNEQAQQQQQLSNLMNVAQMHINEDQRGFDNQNTTAGLTGYLPMNEDAQRYVDAILNLKRQAETKGIAADQRNQLSTQADTYRAMLAKMGVDPSAYGANVNSSNASQVSPMIRTLQGQQFDQNKTQQQFENKFNTAQFDYQKARDLIKDKQYQQQFDEDNRRFGLNYAMDNAYKNGQLALSQDDNARQWASLDFDMRNAGGSDKYSGFTPGQVVSSIITQFSDPDTGKLPKDATSIDGIVRQLAGYDLPDSQERQAFLSLGFTPKEIDDIYKSYGVSSGK